MSKKISELPATTTLTDNDEVVVNHIDTSGTDPETITSKMTVSNLKSQLGINGKAEKASGATSGNVATLDSDGNPVDSGKTLEKSVPSDAEFTDTQSDWSQNSTAAKDYIKNKPTLGTASAKDVPASGNASSAQVVMGSDTRLTDSRPASDVSAWAKASTKPSYTASEVGAIATTAKGAANGVAELDSTGKVPSAQLPSYVDDVIEGYYYNSKFYSDSSHTTEITPETGKIYVDLSTDKTYRWSGTAYTQIKGDLALGETSTTAYRGDRGKTAYNHSQVTSGNPHNVSKSDVELGNVVNTGDSATPISGGTTKFTTGGAYTELAKKADKVSGATSGNVATLDSNGNLTDSGKTLGKSVPSDAVFTDTNNKVTQTNTTGSADYRVLLSDGANDTTETKGARKSTNLKFNPSTGNLQATQLNGVNIGSSPKFTDNDTKNTAGSTDSSSKLFLIGATSQAANPQTYSHDTAYVGTDGCLYSNSKKVLTDHQDISGKADKVTSATNGNFAGLDSNGNLTDSGKKASDFLTNHQTIKQDGVTGATANRFGTCSTAAGTAAKTVSITTGTYSLEAGARVSVKFSNANTAATPTLNVGSTGAKNIFYKGSQITTAAIGKLLRGTVEFIYDGTQYHLIGAAVGSESASSSGTDLSLVTTGEKYTWNNKQNSLSAMTQSDADNGTATTARSITAKVLNDATVKKAQTLYGETMLSSSANLNTYKAPTYKGNYYYYIAGHSISNMPTGLSGQPFRLTVESLGDKEGNIATGTGELDIDYTDATLQTLIVTNINNQNEVKTYRRTCVNSVWKDWVSYEDEIAKLNSGLIIQPFITYNSKYQTVSSGVDAEICKKVGPFIYYVAAIIRKNDSNLLSISRSVNDGLLEFGSHSLNITRSIRINAYIETNSSTTRPVPCLLYLSTDKKVYLYLTDETKTATYPVYNVYLYESMFIPV